MKQKCAGPVGTLRKGVPLWLWVCSMMEGVWRKWQLNWVLGLSKSFLRWEYRKGHCSHWKTGYTNTRKLETDYCSLECVHGYGRINDPTEKWPCQAWILSWMQHDRVKQESLYKHHLRVDQSQMGLTAQRTWGGVSVIWIKSLGLNILAMRKEIRDILK